MIIRRRGINEANRINQVERKRFVEGEVVLKGGIHDDAAFLAGNLRAELNDFALEQRAEEFPGPLAEVRLNVLRFVRIADEALHRGATVPFATEDVEEHPVMDLKAGDERLGG